jgi:Fe(3+) dicitrate transport protein
VGWLPGYIVWDAQLSLVVYKGIRLNGGVNNLFDAHYATRRAGGYPGPGVLPGMGRTLYAGLVMQW